MTIIGYARVSTLGQELDIQLSQLRAAGCEQLFFEKESGMKENRAAFDALVGTLKPGDTVIVAALDRLTRIGPFQMLTVLNEITVKDAVYRSLAEPWVDQANELGEVLAALQGYVARKTRDDIVRRTSAGREQARLRGVRFGRKPKLSPAQRAQALARWLAGEPQRHVAKSYNVSCSTISRLRVTHRVIQ